MNPHAAPDRLLRERYHSHLASPLAGRGSVAGKHTRKGMRRASQWALDTMQGWEDLAQAWQHRPESVWAWSDLHLGHENVIGYCDRPFRNASQMDFEMARNARVVGHDDWVLILGDIAMWRDFEQVAAWINGCPGRKAVVIGNHDVRGKGAPLELEAWQRAGVEAVADVAVLPAAHGAPRLWATHYPLPVEAIAADTVNLHGHTHDKALAWPRVSACVEQLGYRPVNLLDRVLSCRG